MAPTHNLLSAPFQPSLLGARRALHRHPDITSQGIAAELKCEIVRHHSGHKQAPESSVESWRKTTQFNNTQSAFFTHRAKFSRFDEVAQFMQAGRRVLDEPFHALDPEQPTNEIAVEGGEEEQSTRL